MRWFRFPAWVQFFVWVSRGQLGALLWKLCWLTLRDVIGEALPSSEVVEFVILWCYGLARSWTSLVGFVVRVQRAGFQVSLARVGARSYEFRSTRELQEREERERAHSRVVLNCPSLDIAHRRLVQSERRYGAEPRLHGCSCKAFSCDETNNFWSLY